MRRPRGSGGLFLRGRTWWLAYYVNGTLVRESARTPFKKQAEALLRSKLTSVDSGTVVAGKAPTVAEIEQIVQRDHENNGRVTNAARGFAHVRRHLGDGLSAREINASRIEKYKADRLAEGAARGSIALELAWLRRGLRLAVEHKRLAVVPDWKSIAVGNRREGFLTREQFEAVRHHLPSDVADLVTLLYLIGWRKSEGLTLEWRHVDRTQRVIKIEKTKNRTPRTVPYGALPELADLIEKRWRIAEDLRARGVLTSRVFVTSQGRPVADFGRVWRIACKAAGVAGKIIHDMRRSAANNMLRAGVPQAAAMLIGGWKTDSMFRRYAMVDEKLIGDAMALMAKARP